MTDLPKYNPLPLLDYPAPPFTETSGEGSSSGGGRVENTGERVIFEYKPRRPKGPTERAVGLRRHTREATLNALPLYFPTLSETPHTDIRLLAPFKGTELHNLSPNDNCQGVEWVGLSEESWEGLRGERVDVVRVEVVDGKRRRDDCCMTCTGPIGIIYLVVIFGFILLLIKAIVH